MKTPKFTKTFLIISLLLYNYFFWNESFGINIFIFTIMLTGFQLSLNPGSSRSRFVRLTITGTFISSLAVLFFNSDLSKVVHIISFMIMSGFIHESRLRSVFFAVMQTITAYLRIPAFLRQKARNAGNQNVSVKSGVRTLHLSIVPLIVTIVFYVIFRTANPVFKDLSDAFWEKIGDFFSHFFDFISFARFIFLLFGFILLSGLLYNQHIQHLLNKELEKSDMLKRVRKGIRKFKMRFRPEHVSFSGRNYYPMNVLKTENIKGVMLIAMVNIVLLIVNVIDINWLWFGFDVPLNFSMKQFVHEGTYLLILSILLSIAILLYYFRNNQNFYRQNSLLRNLSYLWILQNVVLCISVGLRNYHYINLHGLAYKRIGVIIFLILTFIGLITMYIKIRKVRSFYYLLRVNSWALYVVMLAATLNNWDVSIAKYNLNHWNTSQIDVDFYLELSDKALPVIYENLPLIRRQIETHSDNQEIWIRHLSMESFMAGLEAKKQRFLFKENDHTWCSWNLPDHHTSEYLSQNKAALSKLHKDIRSQTQTQAQEDDRFFEEMNIP